jgi:hypothetical protein
MHIMAVADLLGRSSIAIIGTSTDTPTTTPLGPRSTAWCSEAFRVTTWG